LLACLIAFVGVGSAWPTATALVAALLVVLARTADRTATAAARRREERGARGSDPLLAAVSTPWHLVRAALASVPALVLPVVLGVSSAICAGVASGSAAPADGANTLAATQIAAAVGLLVGVLVAWWGPGGASVRRGSRSLTRGMVRGAPVTTAVVVLCLAAAVGAAYLAYTRGHPDFGPIHQLPLGITLP
jgi:hypothetical protein